MEKETKKDKSTDKEKYWTFMMYLDSRPEDWKEILQESGLQIGISPLHDRDIEPDGTLKKPHHHVLLCFNGPTTFRRVMKLIEPINGTIAKRVISPIGLVRYFTHMDNPEKAQYNAEDIISINGFDPKDINGITKSMEEALKRAIIDIIRVKGIEEYSVLIDYLRDNELWDMFDIASNKTIFINTYLTSYRHKEK